MREWLGGVFSRLAVVSLRDALKDAPPNELKIINSDSSETLTRDHPFALLHLADA